MGKAGLYIHIPFCKSKCPYCDFYSMKYDEEKANNYVKKLISSMSPTETEFDTIYFGGGTPSILEPNKIEEILNSVYKNYHISKNPEITIECNPSKDLKNDFLAYNSFGINRISLGMQSAVNKERFALGRSASQLDVLKAINYARSAGITNISLDLMLGVPNQTLETLDESLEFIKKVQVPHISAYMLKIEEGTKFFELKDKLALPDEDTVCDLYLKTVSTLEKIGLVQYEISNFAKIGFESKHNTKYWLLDEYLGLGASAHSFMNGKRFYTNKDFEIIEDGTGGDKNEQIMLGLRLKKGVPKSLIKKDYKNFIKFGFMEENGDNICLTPKGMLISNTIINELT